MDFATATKTVLSKYVDFQGRASRSEYWYWVLAYVLFFIALAIIEGALLTPMLGFEAFATEAGQPLQMLMALALFLPSLAVSVRRMHDTDRSGWWLLICLLPLVGGLILLWWYVKPGTEGSNQYG